MDIRTAKLRYSQQKAHAAVRGIEWLFTFVQWLEWWGDDLDNRGVRPWNLQMQRFHDKGPYAPWNVRKGRPVDNSRTAANVMRGTTQQSLRDKARAEFRDAPPCPSRDWDYMDENERELEHMFGVRTTTTFHV